MAQSSPGPDYYDQPSGGGRGGVRLVALLLIVALVAAAGLYAFKAWQDSRDDDPVAPQSNAVLPAPADNRLKPYYDQQLKWRDCGGNECTTFEVPLDYEKPDGKRISIAVLKVPAARPGKRLGSLVVNPGGPGGSGIEYAAYGSLQFGAELSDRYDIVGFDPRGVGESTPIECLDTAELDRAVSFDPDPDTEDERQEFDEIFKGFGDGCVEESGDLAGHVSTVEVVKDMDVLRAALREDRLDYLGASYGTYLGATYAELFGKNVGRFVLDGAVDPTLSSRQLSLEQAGGFETALRAFAEDCVRQGGCFLGDSADAALDRIRGLLDELEEETLPTRDDDRPLTRGLGMIGIWLPLYVKSYWPVLTKALRAAIEEGDGADLLDLADQYLDRGDDAYGSNSMEVLSAVNCLDHGDFVRSEDVPKEFEAFDEASPTFGRSFAWALAVCQDWPVKTDRKAAAITAAGAPPIVVVGTTRDPATPLRWSEALADQLASGRLIVRDGDGHTGFNQGNDCVDDAVEAFLIDGKVPPKRLEC